MRPTVAHSPLTAVYCQSSGVFFIKDSTFQGYAGRKAGRNEPSMQSARNLGPLPRGRYTMGLAFTHPRMGPVTIRLTPVAGTEMFGRSGFLIHGDNARGDASNGCIILPRTAREYLAGLIRKGEARNLDVVEFRPRKLVNPPAGRGLDIN